MWFSTRKKVTPIILQMEAAECGAASLAMILGYFGRAVSLEDIRMQCGVSRNGSHAKNILDVASSYGLEGKAFSVPSAKAHSVSTPFIAFWSQNHFLVVTNVRKNAVDINDPAMGRYTISKSEFSAHFSNIALTFVPTDSFVANHADSNNVSASFLAPFSSLKKKMVLLSLFMAFTLILSIGLIDIILIDVFLENQIHLLPIITLSMLSLGTLYYISFRRFNETTLVLQQSIARRLMNGTFLKIDQIPLSFFEQRIQLELLSRLLLIKRLSIDLVSFFNHRYLSWIYIAGVSVMLLQYHAVITLIALASLTGSKLFMAILKKNDEAIQNVMNRNIKQIRNMAVTIASNTTSFFIASSRSWYASQLKDLVLRTEPSISRSFKSHLDGHVILFLFLLASSLPVFLSGLIVVMETRWLFSEFLVFMFYFCIFQVFIYKFESAHLLESRIQLDAQRVNELIDTTTITYNQPHHYTSNANKLSLKVINLSYQPTLFSTYILDNVSFDVDKAGVYLLKKNSPGKSVFFKLLLGHYSFIEGDVFVDDANIKYLSHIDRSLIFSYCSYNPSLHPGTIIDYIRGDHYDIRREDVVEAAKKTTLLQIIDNKHMSLDDRIESGGLNFSVSERIVISLTRSIVQRSSILLIDDALDALPPYLQDHLLSVIKSENKITLLSSNDTRLDNILTERLYLDGDTHEAS